MAGTSARGIPKRAISVLLLASYAVIGGCSGDNDAEESSLPMVKIVSALAEGNNLVLGVETCGSDDHVVAIEESDTQVELVVRGTDREAGDCLDQVTVALEDAVDERVIVDGRTGNVLPGWGDEPSADGVLATRTCAALASSDFFDDEVVVTQGDNRSCLLTVDSKAGVLDEIGISTRCAKGNTLELAVVIAADSGRWTLDWGRTLGGDESGCL